MMPIPGGRPTGTKLERKSFSEDVLMEERDDVELEVSIRGGGALAGSVTTLETASEEAKGGVTVPPCLMVAGFLAARDLDDAFLLLLGAMIQKMKEKRQKTRSRKNMSEEKNIYQTEGRLHIIETY